MGIAILTFVAVFLLVASVGLLAFYREAMAERISEAIHPYRRQRSLLSALQKTGSSLGGMVERFEQVLPKSQAEVSVIKQRLIRAGFRGE